MQNCARLLLWMLLPMLFTLDGVAQNYTPLGALIPPEGNQAQVLDISEANGFAYVLTNQGTLHIYDLTSFSQETSYYTSRSPMQTLSVPGAEVIVEQNQFLYLLGENGVSTYLLNDPINPQQLGELKEGALPFLNGEIHEGLLIGMGDNGVSVYSLASPGSPVFLGNYTSPNQERFLAGVGQNNFYFVSATVDTPGGGSGQVPGVIYMFDLSNPDDLSPINTIFRNSAAYQLHIRGGELFECGANHIANLNINALDDPFELDYESTSARSCILDGDRIITNGDVFWAVDQVLLLEDTFDDNVGQDEDRPYGGDVTEDYVLFARSNQVEIVGDPALFAGPRLTFSPDSLDFGDVEVGVQNTLTIQFTNDGDTRLSIEVIRIIGADANDFSVLNGAGNNIPPGNSRDVTIGFTPGSTGIKNAQLEVLSDAPSSPDLVTLTGNGFLPNIGELTFNPPSLSFGDVLVGANNELTIAVENTGTGAFQIEQMQIQGNGASHFSFVSGNQAGSVPEGSSRQVVISYAPTQGGPHAAQLVVNTDLPDSPDTANLSGQGVTASLSLTPGSHTFSDLPVGESQNQVFVLLNDGGVDVNINQISIRAPGDEAGKQAGPEAYSISSGGQAGTLAPGASRNIDVTFSPETAALHEAVLEVVSDAANSPRIASLSGQGIGASIVVAPGTVGFQDTSVGSSSLATLQVSNPGNSPLTISSVSIRAQTGNSPPGGVEGFSLPDLTVPVQVEAGGSAQIQVAFAPLEGVSYGAELVMASNAPTGETVVPLTGNGLAPSLQISPATVDFGSREINTTAQATVTLTNDGNAPVQITGISIADVAGKQQGAEAYAILSGGENGSIAPGNSRSVVIEFAPETAEAHPAELQIRSNVQGSPDIVALNGIGTEAGVSLSPSPLQFGNVALGATADLTLVLTNTGTAPVSLSGMSIAGAQASFFSIVSGNAEVTVQPEGSHDIVIRYAPNAAGSHEATLSVQNNAPGNPHAVSLSGTGTAAGLAISPNPITFAETAVGLSINQLVTLTNTGNTGLEISSIAIEAVPGTTGSGAFVIAGGGASGTLAAGASRNVTVQFTPEYGGNHQAQLVVASDADSSPDVVNISGRGAVGSLVIAPSPVSFQNTAVGSTRNLDVILTNTGNTTVAISSMALGELTAGKNGAEAYSIVSGGQAGSLEPEASRVIRIQFAPDTPGLHEAQLIVNSDIPSSPTSAILSGTGTQGNLTLAPSTLEFQATPVGGTLDQSLILTNQGTAPVSIAAVTLSGPQAGAFSFVSGNEAGNLAPGVSRTLAIRFTPDAVGTFNATVSVESNAPGSPIQATLTATGIAGGLAITPNPIVFAATPVGDQRALTVMLNNTGEAPIAIQSMVIGALTANKGPEAYSITSGGGAVTLQPGASQEVVLAFAPGTAELHEAELVITSDAPSSPHTTELRGLGTAPSLALSTTSLSFGDVGVGLSVTDTLVLENTGSQDLTLSGFQLTGEAAGDFALVSGADDGVLVIGETRSVIVAFTPNAAGAFAGTLTFTSNATDSPHTVALSGNGVEGAFALSTSALTFEGTPVGSSSSQPLMVSNTGSVPVSILPPQLTEDTVNAFSILNEGAGFELAPGGSIELVVGFTPNAPGTFTASLQLQAQGQEEIQTVTLTGVGLEGIVDFTPGRLDFGAVAVGQFSEQDVVLANNGNAPIQVTGIALGGADVSAFEIIAGGTGGTLAEGTSQTVSVRFSPTRSGNHGAVLLVSTDIFETPLEVLLSGNGVTGGLTLSVTNYNFPDAPLGNQSEASFRFNNSGQADLSFSALVIQGDEIGAFSIISGGDAGSLPPGGNQEVLIRFTPQRLGLHTAQILINHEGDNTPAVVNVSGNGILSIINTTTGVPVIGEALQIEVTKPSLFSSLERTVYYRRSGESSYQQIAMLDNPDQFVATIPASYVTERGVDYYIELTDETSSVTIPSQAPALNPIHVQVQLLPFAPGISLEPMVHRMVSLPIALDSAVPEDVFEDDYGIYDRNVWRLHQWNPESGSYFEHSEATIALPPGQAAWLITETGDGFDVEEGLSVDASEPFTLTLQPGWNQIGTPYPFAVSWSANLNASSQEVIDALENPVAYSGLEYLFDQDILNPWEGYFVFNRSEAPVSIELAPVEAADLSADKADTLAVEKTLQVQLIAEWRDRGKIDTQNFAGWAPSSIEGVDPADISDAPPFGDYVRLSFIDSEVPLSSSIMPAQPEGNSWDFEVEAIIRQEIIPIKRQVTVRINELIERNAGHEMYVLDLEKGRSIAIEEGYFSIELEPANPSRKFRLIVGSEHFAAGKSDGINLEPLEMALHQNYPNPFTPGTEIRYLLSEKSQVQLEVFNMLGQRVLVLVDQEQEGGSHAVSWNGVDAAGRPLASGVYLYRLRANDFTATRKMVLVR